MTRHHGRGMVRWVYEGEVYPRGFGRVRRDWACNRTLAAPMPLNIVLRLAAWVEVKVRFPFPEAERDFWRAGAIDRSREWDRRAAKIADLHEQLRAVTAQRDALRKLVLKLERGTRDPSPTP